MLEKDLFEYTKHHILTKNPCGSLYASYYILCSSLYPQYTTMPTQEIQSSSIDDVQNLQITCSLADCGYYILFSSVSYVFNCFSSFRFFFSFPFRQKQKKMIIKLYVTKNVVIVTNTKWSQSSYNRYVTGINFFISVGTCLYTSCEISAKLIFD